VLFSVRDGLTGLVDTLANSVAFIDDAGSVVGRASLPAGFIVSATQQEDGRVLLLSGDKSFAVEIARTIDPAAAGTLVAKSIARPRAAPADIVRRNKWQLTLPTAAGTARAGQPRIDVRSLSGDPLADATQIAVDAEGRLYVVWSEFVSASPNIVVRAFVGRFGLDGRLVGVAEVPLADMDYVPDEYATVTRAGELRVMVPTRSGIEIRTIPMREIPAVSPRSATRLVQPSLLKALQSEKGRVLKVETQIGGSPDKLEQRNELPLRGRAAAAPKPITRAKVLELAREFVTQEWTLEDKNYQRPGTSSVCAKEERQYWERPSWLREELVGKKVTRIPYKWGGFDSPAVYVQRLSQGNLAGSVCTCRDSSHNDCTVSVATGVDCSGFVSRAWGLASKEGTSSLPSVSTTISRWEQNLGLVKAGDALNKSGNHVRLVVEVVTTPQIRVIVLESTTSPTCTSRDGTKAICEGVCECARPITDFAGYRLLRFKAIRD
jgi:hypothetical protein